MATATEVEDAIGALVAAAIYPGGLGAPSVAAMDVLVARGWPQMADLDAALMGSPAQARVAINRMDGMTRDTTRYSRAWRTQSVLAPGVTVALSGGVASFAGSATGGEIAGVQAAGVDYPVLLTAGQTASQVAAALAAAINAGGLVVATATGAALTVASLAGDPLTLGAVVVGSGTSARELGRAETEYVIVVFAPSKQARDTLEAAAMLALDQVDRLALSDGPSGPVRFVRARVVDTAELDDLYRVDLHWRIEVGRTQIESGAQMAFPVGTLDLVAGGASARFGFGGLVLPAPLVIPPIGAIRFDAWYDPSNTIDAQCAAALSPAAYHFRLPGNAAVSGGAASWPLATQATMDAEIVAAKLAGLQFWAFDSYAATDTLSLALQLYLSSPVRAGLAFAMLGQSSAWADTTTQDGYSASFHSDVSMMTQPGYLTVLSGRPVYFVLDGSAGQLAALPGGLAGGIAKVRTLVQAAGGGDPYVVFLSGAALADYDNTGRAIQVGADAAGSYCTPRLNGSEQPFATLAAQAVTDWSERATGPLPMVPTAMTGWDQRPLIQTPQPFYPISPYLSMGNYYDTATAAQIGAHVTAMAQWIVANPSPCPAQFGLVYAWNELAEGGWMMPTYTPAGPDLSRCAATGAALAAAVALSRAPTLPLLA